MASNPVCASHSFLFTLREIHEKAGKMKALAEQRLTLQKASLQHTQIETLYPIPTLSLVLPDDIDSEVTGISDELRSEVLWKIRQSMSVLRDLYHRNFEKACRQILAISSDRPQPISKIFIEMRRAYETSFANRVANLKTDAVMTLRARFESNKNRKKSPFNTECVPFLERYFEQNAYPSTEHRLALASRTSMTPRQIEVWFQNHRNRAKKDGRKVCKSDSSKTLLLLLDSTENSSDQSGIEEGDSVSMADDQSDDAQSSEDSWDTKKMTEHLTSDRRPPHAFPTKYPPNLEYDPFSSESGCPKFDPPVWQRKPSTSTPRTTPICMDEFVTLFASKLNLLECRRSKKVNNSSRSTKLWFSSTTTIPFSAPLPSFVQLSYPDKSTPFSCPTKKTHRLPPSQTTSRFSSYAIPPFEKPRKSGLLKRHPDSSPMITTPLRSFTHHSAPFRPYSRSRVSSSSSNTSDESLSSPPTPMDSPSPCELKITDVTSSYLNLDQLFDPGHDASLLGLTHSMPFTGLACKTSAPFDFPFDFSPQCLEISS